MPNIEIHIWYNPNIMQMIYDSNKKREFLISYYEKEDFAYRIDNERDTDIIYNIVQSQNKAETYVDDKKPELMRNFGIVSEISKKYTDAARYYLIAIDENNNYAMNNLAALYQKLERYTDAERYYLMAIDKNNINAVHNLALMYEDLEKYVEAERYYLIAIDKNDTYAMNNLASMYEDLERYTDAERYYLMSIEIETDDTDAGDVADSLAQMYDTQKKYTDAEYYYLMAIDKNNIGAINNLAAMYETLGRYTDAEKYYLQAIQHKSETSAYNLKRLYEQQHQYKDLFIINKKYNIDINDIVHKILKNKINIDLDLDTQKLLCGFDIHNEYTFKNMSFNTTDFCLFKIFKKIGVIPVNLSPNMYITYKLITSANFMDKISIVLKFKIPRVIWICICRKLFGNDL